MPDVKRYMNTTNGWQQTSSAVKAHATELEHLGTFCAKLDVHLDQALALNNEQSAFAAGKQEATTKLIEVLRNGNLIADVLRTALREHYGVSSEKLVEFGIKPFRGRARKTSLQPPDKPEPEPDPIEVLSPASSPDTVK